MANEITVFFNRQYFTNRLISDFHFGHVDDDDDDDDDDELFLW